MENRYMREREGSGNSPRLWRHGVALMAGAALLSKLIGALQKIPLQNMAGDRVFGMYNAVYPFYQMIAVLATAGLPTAVSIVIASRLADEGSGSAVGASGTRSALMAALLLLGATGTVTAVLMWTTAGQTAAWLGDEAVAPAIRALALSLLVAPLAAALRGYMQGMQRMGISAASQLAEQLVRVAVMLLVLGAGLAAGWRDSTIAAGVMFGGAAGAAVSLLLLVLGSRTMTGKREAGAGSGVISKRKLFGEMKDLVALALPAALAALVVPAVAAVDSFTVPALLRAEGRAPEEAMSLFGIYGRGQPLVQLIVMAAGAGAAAMVPGLVRARAEVQRRRGGSGLGGDEAKHKFESGRASRKARRTGGEADGGFIIDGAKSAGLRRTQDQNAKTVGNKRSGGAVIEADNNGDDGAAEMLGLRLTLLLRLAWLLGGAATIGLVLLAEPINVMLYKDASGTTALALIGFTALAGCVSAVVAPALQALGAARIPALLLLLAALLKGALNAALVPSLGIEGAALSGVVALSAAAMLGAAALHHAAARLRLPHGTAPAAGGWRPAAAGVFALAVMAAALWLCERALGGGALEGLPPRAAAAVLALTGVAVGAAAFGAAMLRGGAIGAREWRALPGGEELAARLRRRGLIPPK
ncbi:oligosaccharide flippase family protein [Paenibacillus agaridevorans]|uniref:oligosaccharide flippase family protein n=1 Tax=Paenibacillus agaridevorans TaxID=171404 RepID=UPI001BE435CB|nr:oligosaccharide flippase family protein [Paenibacillus agaridevorans]